MEDLRIVLLEGKAVLPASLSEPLDPTFKETDALANLADISEALPALRPWPVSRIRFMWDSAAKLRPLGLGSDRDAFEPLMDALIAAESEIVVVTPYAIVGDKSYKIARKARKKSPDIRLRLVTNSVSSSDNIYASSVALKQRRIQLDELNFEMHLTKPVPGGIREFVPRYDELLRETAALSDPDKELDPDLFPLNLEGPRFCLHTKSMVIDRNISYVGSHNFDPRSFNLNTECGVMIEDRPFAEHLVALAEETMAPANSWVVAPRDYPPVLAEVNSLITLITSNLPMFDIWPLEHVTCYDLKEGCEPVPPSHPDFYNNYQDVGPLPGLDLELKSVQAQVIRAFGGFASPLM